MLLSKSVFFSVLAIVVTGCSLPSAGPTVTQVQRSADPRLDVYLVKANPKVVAALSSYTNAGFPEPFRVESHRPSVALQPGDVIGVSIYEAGGSPLFGNSTAGAAAGQSLPQANAATQGTNLPTQIVEANGQILIPFVGRVRVSGLTPAQAAEDISQRLAAQTVRPQVIVSLVGNMANTLSVGGEVNKAGLVSLTLRGERLLDVIAQAGGPKYPAVETDVRLMRGRDVAVTSLQQIMQSPRDNVVVRPSDAVVLVHNPKTFVVMGAVTKVSQYTMETERVTLAEGIARAGGTVDTYGNLAGVFLMRYEPTGFARSVLQADEKAVDASYVETAETRNLAGATTRMIYHFDLTESGGYFFAQKIALRDKDIILVANAEATQVQKAMAVLRAFTGAYFDLSRGAAFYVPTNP